MTDFTRRSVMIGAGSLAAGFAIGIPQTPIVAAPIDTTSPLISTQHGDVAHLLRLCYSSPFEIEALQPYNIAEYYSRNPGCGSRRIDMKLAKMGNGIPVSSVIDAENLVISKATVVHENWLPDSNVNYVTNFDEGPAFFSYGLRRQAAYLSCENCRGWPSGTLMHPSMAEKLKSRGNWIGEHDYKAFPGPKIGRWDTVGILQKCGVAYTNEVMPENEAILFYNHNTYDGAAVFLHDGQNASLIVAETSVEHPHGIESYIKRVIFT